MSDLYRTVKRLPSTELADHGFRYDRLKEGFFKTLSDDRSISFLINGMWSHVELFVTLRFTDLNDTLFKAACRADWPRERAQMFRLESIGLFLEKVGDYCGSTEDIGIYCPPGSTIASPQDISRRILKEVDRLTNLISLQHALKYVCDHSLFEPLGSYMIPAAAMLVGDQKIWDWSTSHFAETTSAGELPHYHALLKELERE